MLNHTAHLSRDALRRSGVQRRTVLALLSLAVSATFLGPAPPSPSAVPGGELEGRDESVYVPTNRPTIEAAFSRESYRPGAVARLVIFSKLARGVSLQVWRAGTESGRLSARDEMGGTPATELDPLGTVRQHQTVRVRIPHSPSGLYFAKLTGRGGRIGYAPFVLRPRRLGEHRVAEVLPTLSWQAYNYHDDNGDGQPDSWYANQSKIHTASLYRPYTDRGVPRTYRDREQPFLRWLIHKERDVDYLAQTDLARTNGRTLAAAYDLLIFSGHHEYVTEREYDAVEQFRNRGGNLMFLSANNFFWKVVIRRGVMHKIRQWRDLGRPEAALIGVQYIGNNRKFGRYVVRGGRTAPWLFDGTGLRNGSRFSKAGIEIDKTNASSPAGTKVVAEIPNLFGPGWTAQMTYYQKGRAKVFAAGAFSFASSVWWPQNELLMENLWKQFARP